VTPLVVSLFLLGVASGVHCVGMCGGFVAAFTSRRVIPIAPARNYARLLAFNAGRITSYAVAGAFAGQAAAALGAQSVLYVLANVLLVAIGLHLAGLPVLSSIEKVTAPLWRRVQPLWVRTANPYAAGLLWGWIPCGLVYGALAAAAFAGSAGGGAAAMAAYGLGTLPWLMAGGIAFQWIGRKARALSGAAVLAFGVYGLAHGTDLRGLLCLIGEAP
jgi:sulfite exporter TauE/SafE